EAERDVVHEPALADSADVHLSLLPVEGGQSADRILGVEPEIAGEVVPGPEGDANEGPVFFDGHAGNGSDRAVAARHADRPGGLADNRLRVVAFGQESHV